MTQPQFPFFSFLLFSIPSRRLFIQILLISQFSFIYPKPPTAFTYLGQYSLFGDQWRLVDGCKQSLVIYRFNMGFQQLLRNSDLLLWCYFCLSCSFFHTLNQNILLLLSIQQQILIESNLKLLYEAEYGPSMKKERKQIENTEIILTPDLFIERNLVKPFPIFPIFIFCSVYLPYFKLGPNQIVQQILSILYISSTLKMMDMIQLDGLIIRYNSGKALSPEEIRDSIFILAQEIKSMKNDKLLPYSDVNIKYSMEERLVEFREELSKMKNDILVLYQQIKEFKHQIKYGGALSEQVGQQQNSIQNSNPIQFQDWIDPQCRDYDSLIQPTLTAKKYGTYAFGKKKILEQQFTMTVKFTKIEYMVKFGVCDSRNKKGNWNQYCYAYYNTGLFSESSNCDDIGKGFLEGQPIKMIVSIKDRAIQWKIGMQQISTGKIRAEMLQNTNIDWVPFVYLQNIGDSAEVS